MEIGITVKNYNDWKEFFPPAGGDKQWKDGYSAMEFAKIVTGFYSKIDFEKKLKEDIFNKYDDFSIIHSKVYPERISTFDNVGRGRHHDLACYAQYNKKTIALCFEAKVFENLDKKLEKYFSESNGKKERLNKLCKHFFGKTYCEDYKNIYYQILSAIAGSIAFAAEENVEDVYFIFYQIIPEQNNKGLKNKDDKIKQHKDALNLFLECYNKQLYKAPIKKSGDIINLGNLGIEREKGNNKEMTANVYIVYIEQEVSGKKCE